jgi:hypothetical protein
MEEKQADRELQDTMNLSGQVAESNNVKKIFSDFKKVPGQSGNTNQGVGIQSFRTLIIIHGSYCHSGPDPESFLLIIIYRLQYYYIAVV